MDAQGLGRMFSPEMDKLTVKLHNEAVTKGSPSNQNRSDQTDTEPNYVDGENGNRDRQSRGLNPINSGDPFSPITFVSPIFPLERT